ncbi:MAG: hypothetical protein E7496_07380 [Ruminococcus sp.]|nr:hypothetical protein [Ruminococcus sp.]
MNLEDLNLSVHTFNMLCRQGIKSKADLTAVLDDPEKHETLRNALSENCYTEVMNAMNRTIYPRTSLDEIGLSAVLTACARRNGISTAEELAESVSNPASLWSPEHREEFCRHLKEHGYLETESTDIASDWDDTEFEELPGTEIMSADYTQAVRLNNHIKAHAQIAQESLYEVCKGLKEMRDNKLYKELNYQNFEEYCEKEVGIKRHQAMKYAKIAELENVDSNQHLGVTKLYLLAKLDEPQREEVIQKVDIDSVSVKEMQKQIKELTKKNQEKQAEFDEFREGAKRRQDTLLTKLKEKTAQNQELENQITELENQPRDTVFENDPFVLEENEKLKTENQELKTKLAEKPQVQEMLPSDGETFSERRAEFRAYLKTLNDTMNHICSFVAKYHENQRISEVEQTVQKYINVMKG